MGGAFSAYGGVERRIYEGHLARMGERRDVYMRERDPLGDLRVDWRIILRCIFRRILHNEELNDLYSSPNIVRVIKSRRMRWAGHVARMGEERGCLRSWWGNRRQGTTGET